MTENSDTTASSGPAPDEPSGSTPAGGTTTAPPPPPYLPGPELRPPLRRSLTDRKVAGVAGGLGRHFGIDPLVFRVVLVTLAIFGGSGLLLYAIGWLLVPEDGETESEAAHLINGRATSKVLGGIILAVVGVAVVGNFARTGFGFGGFAALIAIGVAAYLISRDGSRPAPAPQQPPAPQPTPPGAFGQTTGTAYAGARPATPYVPYPASTYATAPYAGGGAPPSAPPAAQPGWYPPPPPRPKEPRSPLGRITASLAVLVAGVLVSISLATTHDFSAEVVLAACLGVVAVGLVISAFVGRARGLIILGAFLAVATTIASFNPVGYQGGVGDRVWHPRTVASVQEHSPYRLGIGDAHLDLTDLDVSSGKPVHIDARIGVGSLTVTVPPDVPVRVVADLQAGSVQALSADQQDGTDVREDVLDPGDATRPLITIDVRMGVGNLEVFRATS